LNYDIQNYQSQESQGKSVKLFQLQEASLLNAICDPRLIFFFFATMGIIGATGKN
jgi:hypothetical protein